ncbi:alginate export family protein [Alteromonas flava]|uniref:alginate export family protein n=1 Tax=Alteromonas flava TaxID=2048003 RepID=UPI000C2952F6|nr:alginate export family protein [Alteromonas flava]
MQRTFTSICLSAVFALPAMAAIETDFGSANIDFRLRYEGVDQNNALNDANALTLRTFANFKTKANHGFSIFVEVENNLALIDDYNDTLGDGTQYSVVADPQSTELDQAYVQYQQDNLTAKLGRQVINLDNHRFVGNVGWRQDKQTFDAVSVKYTYADAEFFYAYIDKRNRIFADERDIDAKDHLLNASIKTPAGKLTGYGYLLEVDSPTVNVIDTWGARLVGQQSIGDIPLSYTAEYASQSIEAGANDFDTDYLLLEAGFTLGELTVKAGMESLGSDAGLVAFSTPLATLHKFNGWSDQFLGTPGVGLDDMYVALSGKALEGKWSVIYHDFSADESNALLDDLGSEWNAIYTTKVANKYPVGIKFARYSAGDEALGKVDTNKLWVWAGYAF